MERDVDLLIIGHDGDPHVVSVVAGCEKQGLSHFTLDLSAMVERGAGFDPAAPGFVIGDTHLRSCHLIWLRRTHSFHPVTLPEGDRKFAEIEFTSLLMGALHAMDAEWHSLPIRTRSAGYKPYQLALAERDPRLTIPKTLLTSCPKTARQWLDALGSDAVVKSVEEHNIKTEQGFDVVFTTPMDRTMRENFDDLPLSPCIFQQFIPRRFDVRLTLVGGEVFSATLDTSAYPEAAADSRQVYYDVVPHAEIETPPGIADACRDMCARLGISFGAFDFAIGEDGEWYFLELNPWGQWVWLEEMTGYRIGDAFGRFFANRVQARRQARPG